MCKNNKTIYWQLTFTKISSWPYMLFSLALVQKVQGFTHHFWLPNVLNFMFAANFLPCFGFEQSFVRLTRTCIAMDFVAKR